MLRLELQTRVLSTLKMGNYLNRKYQIVVTNPPYLGNKGMNLELSEFAKENYADSKLDLFAMFMDRTIQMLDSFVS